MIDGFLQAVRSMKNKDAELVEFLDKFDGVCLEAKSDNVQEWSLRLLGAGSAARAGASCFPPTAEEPSRFSADEGNHAFGTHDAE